MRNAGIHVPLIIDGTQWGQNIDILQANGPYLITQDPDRNLMFSVHMWWVGRSASTISSEISQSVALNLPLIVGEFAEKGVGCSCCIDYKAILQLCNANEIGWLAWEWGPGNGDCGEMDMTPNNMFNSLWGWAKVVTTTDPNSIRNTAKPVATLNSSSCQ
jgi:mannan endo-1,4-beta-mannosidase